MANEDLEESGGNIKPPLDMEKAVELIKEHYAMTVIEMKKLNGYDDCNFFFKTESSFYNPFIQKKNEDGYVLKITNSVESQFLEVLEGQNKMMGHLSSKGFIVSEPIPNKYGNLTKLIKLTSSDGATEGHYAMRMLKFIPGDIFYNIKPWKKEHFYQCGHMLACLTKALEDFSCPELGRKKKSFWFLSNVPEVKKLIFPIKERERKNLLLDILDAFEKEVLPIEKHFEQQIIHGDFNEQNLLVKKSISNPDEYEIFGVLDFGDSHPSCVVYDLAIAIMYMMTQCTSMDPNLVGGHVIAGYQTMRKLPEKEFEILRTCVAARYAQSLALGAYTHYQNPENTYVLITAERGWDILEKFWKVPKTQLYDSWRSIMDDY